MSARDRGDYPAENAVMASLIGRTITRAEFVDPWRDKGETFDCGEYALVELDDGTVIVFGGYGCHADGGGTVETSPSWVDAYYIY